MKIFVKFLSWVFCPSKCVFCNEVTSKGISFCPDCKEKIKLDPKFCYPPSVSHRDLLCCMSALPYHEQLVRNGILNLKFNHHSASASVFGEILSDMHFSAADGADIITSVPLHKSRMNDRGYNQSELIAKYYANRLGKPYQNLLIKTKRNEVQSTLTDPAKRKENVKGCYEIINNVDISGKTILIVDDVFTTGATMRECADVLKKSGAHRVIGATVCYAE